jgi:hypothetical protein
MRPGDLVGAIANEVGIDAGSIGAIQISTRISTVEVPEIAHCGGAQGDEDQG